LLHELKISAFEAAVVAGVEDVIAVVVCVVGDVLQIEVGSVSCEKASPLSENRLDHETRVVEVSRVAVRCALMWTDDLKPYAVCAPPSFLPRSEEHTSELQSRFDLVCRL